MKKLYIIAGCNGAGKTTVFYTILPEILECDEFVNADEIANELSPFKPERAGIQAGRLMLQKIKTLVNSEQDFAFETTLYQKLSELCFRSSKKWIFCHNTFFWLSSQNLAVKCVETRVKEGGHRIPENVIRRRYENRLKNFLLFLKNWLMTGCLLIIQEKPYQIIAEGAKEDEEIENAKIWHNLNRKYNG